MKRGKSKLLLLVCFILLSTLFAEFRLVNQDNESMILEFDLPNYEVRKEDGFTKFSFVDKEIAKSNGEYELPEFAKFINVPAGYKPVLSYEILDSRKLKNLKVKKSKKFVDQTEISNTNFTEQNIVSINAPGIMHDLVLSRINVAPFIISQNEIEVLRKIKINISFEFDTEAKLPIVDQANDLTRTFNKVTINPKIYNSRSTNLPGKYLFIHNGSANVVQLIEYLADWKKQKGHPVQISSISDIGTSSQSIKDYIQDVYETSEEPLEYVCLVGDSDQNSGITPYVTEVNSTTLYNDFNYSLLDGNDDYPDVLIGRLSYESISDLQTQIAKIIYYERDLENEGEWADKYLLIGDHHNDSGISTVHTLRLIKEFIRDYNIDGEINEVYNPPFNTAMVTGMNSGVGAFFWRGFGNFSEFQNNQVNELTNSRINPFATFISCNTNMFANPMPTIVEQLLRAGSPSAPKGVISAVGTTTYTHTCFNKIVTTGIANYLYEYEDNNLAAALNFGILKMEENFPSNPGNYNDWYKGMLIHMGDPGLSLWLEKPQQFNIECDTLFTDAEQYSLIVKDHENNPVANAVVTFISENINQVFVTDESGIIITNLSDVTDQNITLTISHDKFAPFIQQLTSSESNSVEFENISINSNDAGSDATMSLTLANNTNSSFSGTGNLNTTSEYVTISQETLTFENIASNTTGTSTNMAEFTIAQNCPDQERIIFNIEFDDFEIPVELYVDNHNLIITDLSFSNNIYPGNSSTFTFIITNAGALTSTATDVTINIPNPEVLISDNSENLSSLNPNGDSEELSFALDFSEEMQRGIQTGVLEYTLDGIDYQMFFEFEVQSTSSLAPTTAENVDYHFVNSGDAGVHNPPIYDWVEISPIDGGNGTSLGFSTQIEGSPGDLRLVELPFEFKYFGITYDELTICSNGFVTPGRSNFHSWMNSSIPGPVISDPMIAPFWDALLYHEGSQVYTYYDQSEHYYIVQWTNVHSRTTSMQQNFQLIIYDQEYHETLSGNNKMLFQYDDVSNDDSGTYEGFFVDHGEYATVGIVSHDLEHGIEYTYSNNYPSTAQPLVNNTAILITDRPIQEELSKLVVNDIAIFDLDGNQINRPEAGATVNIVANLKNIGLESFVGGNVEIEVLNGYGTTSINSILVPNISTNQNHELDSFSISIPPAVQNNENVVVRLKYYDGIKEAFCDFNLKIINLEFQVSSLQLIDDGDMFLGQGESAIVRFIVTNNSDIDINNFSATLSTNRPEIISIDNPTISMESPGNQFYLEYDVTASDEFTTGIPATFDLGYECNDVFSGNISMVTYLGDAVLAIDTDMQANIEQIIIENGIVTQSNYAGGDAPELKLGINDFPFEIRNDHVITSNSVMGACEFDIYVADSNNPVIVEFVYWDYQSHYVELDRISDTNGEAVHKQYYLNTAGLPGSCYIRIKGTGSADQNIYMDNFKYSVLYDRSVLMDGYVSLDDGSDLTQVEITTSNSGDYSVTYPDSTGYYKLYLGASTQVVYFRKEGYSSDNYYIIDPEPESHHSYNTELELLNSPYDLQYFIEGDQIRLVWDFDEESRRDKDRNSRNESREFVEFEVRAQLNGGAHITEQSNQEICYILYNPNVEYDIKVYAVYSFGASGMTYSLPSNSVHIGNTDNEEPNVPMKFSLSQNYPNPFNNSLRGSQTKISFGLPYDTDKCEINVYNIKGRRVKKILNSAMKAGNHTITWDGNDSNKKTCSSGVYFYRIKTDKDVVTRKMLLIK
jgi:hypothetical protein